MERVSTLIQKLREQLDQKATPGQMLVTVQMLQNELLAQQKTGENSIVTDKVVVIMPSVFSLQEVGEKNDFKVAEDKLPPIEAEEKIIEVLQVDEQEIEDELEEIKRNAELKNKMSTNAKPALSFDPVEDVPTLTHQTIAPLFSKEINENSSAEGSLNDRLNQNKAELSDKLNDGPLKDLKKGIGINDRFLFINELFRGDEAMYERSIKTINNFSIFPEAEYWIKRELKLKVGWNENDPVVRQFDQLVRRRFS